MKGLFKVNAFFAFIIFSIFALIPFKDSNSQPSPPECPVGTSLAKFDWDNIEYERVILNIEPRDQILDVFSTNENLIAGKVGFNIDFSVDPPGAFNFIDDNNDMIDITVISTERNIENRDGMDFTIIPSDTPIEDIRTPPFDNTGSFSEGEQLHFQADGGSTVVITVRYEEEISGLHFSFYGIDGTDQLDISGTNSAGESSTFTRTQAIVGTDNIVFGDPLRTVVLTFSNTAGSGALNGAIGDLNYCSLAFGPGFADSCLSGLDPTSEGFVLASTAGPLDRSVFVVNLDDGTTRQLFDDFGDDPVSIDDDPLLNTMFADRENSKVYYADNIQSIQISGSQPLVVADNFRMYDGDTATSRSCFDVNFLNQRRERFGEVGDAISLHPSGATFFEGFVYFYLLGSNISSGGELWRLRIPDRQDPCNNPPTEDDAYKVKTVPLGLGDIIINSGILYVSAGSGTGGTEGLRAIDLMDGSEVARNLPGTFEGNISLSAQGKLLAFFRDSATGNGIFQEVEADVNSENYGNLLGDPTILASPWPSGRVGLDTTGCVNPQSSIPITLSEFTSYYAANGVKLLWSTSTEAYNAGFFLYGYKEDGERVKLREELIPTKRPNSTEPQYYEELLNTDDDIVMLGISSVDMRGREEHFGPYEVGAYYGQEPDAKPVDWRRIKEEYMQKLTEDGYRMKGGQMRKTAKKPKLLDRILNRFSRKASEGEMCNIAVGSDGMYRVSYEELMAADCDFLDNARPGQIAVTFKGEPVPRRVKGKNRKFSRGAFIDFYGTAPDGEDYLYSSENIYQVSVNKRLARYHKYVKSIPATFVDEYRDKIEFEKNEIYDIAVPYDGPEKDPWYESYAVATKNKPKSMTFPIAVSTDAVTTESAAVKVRLVGLTDFPGVDTDHEVKIKLNGIPIGDSSYRKGGLSIWDIEAAADGAGLVPGENILEVVATGETGTPFDLVAVDSYSLEYTRPGVASNDYISFTGSEAGYRFRGYSKKFIEAYGYTANGDLYLIRTKRKKARDGSYSAIFKGVGKEVKYWVSNANGFKKAAVFKPEYDNDLFLLNADVLIITHPGLMGDALDGYVDYIEGKGFSTKTVSVQDIYEASGYGMAGIEPIKQFLKELWGIEYVVIVGGTTTAYPGSEEAINYVPTDFRLTNGFIYHTPCDGCLADYDGDLVPDLKIFRLPAREESDITAVVNKARNFSPDTSVLLVADRKQESNYGAQLDSVAKVLGGYDVTRIYIDEVARNRGLDTDNASELEQAVNIAKEGLIEGINEGNSVVMYDGHASPRAWTFNGLFTDKDAGNLTNRDPSIVIPLACYSTYYESPGTESLADRLLFNPDGGSAAISGAAVLSKISDNGVFAKSILDKMCKGKNLAQAVYETKKENPSFKDQIINWDTVGDGFLTIESCGE